MNKYIKKCLLVYVSMAIILCGMVGVTYAITASDADQYVTRSQYAVDMAHLQNKLDEAEAGLMGNINRFRSTDIKMTTWDTPTKQIAATSGYNQGIHNGGNYFPRIATADYLGGWGYVANNNTRNKTIGNYTSYSMYRLWNGNYYITKDMTYNNQNNSLEYFLYPLVNYAVPLESHPGWYLIVKIRTVTMSGVIPLLAVVKLDPTSTTPRPLPSETYIARFKKDLFVYAGRQVTPLTTTKRTRTVQCDVYRETQRDHGPFGCFWANSNREAPSKNQNITADSWIDPETGDYMVAITGMSSCGGSGYYSHLSHWNISYNDNATFCAVMPKDNVEYMTGNIQGIVWAYGGGGTNSFLPDPGRIGTGTGKDFYWQYEFVDCDNGIKFWHAYRPPSKTPAPESNTGGPLPYGIHYQIPIVY